MILAEGGLGGAWRLKERLRGEHQDAGGGGRVPRVVTAKVEIARARRESPGSQRRGVRRSTDELTEHYWRRAFLLTTRDRVCHDAFRGCSEAEQLEDLGPVARRS